MDLLTTRGTESARRGGINAAGYAADFEFGLNLILDGLERALTPRGKRTRQTKQ